MGQTVQHIRPHFDHPPLVEQAITLMFEPIPDFSIGHFGRYWERISDDFVTCVADEPIPSSVESFEPLPNLRIHLTVAATLPRCIYRTRAGGELVQVQNDRFSFNWLRTDGGEYPRFEGTAGRFWAMFEGFTEFLRQCGLAEPTLVQCELTNVNVITFDEWGGSGEVALAAMGVRPVQHHAFKNLSIEAVESTHHYLVSSDDGRPVGRLHSTLQTVQNLATGAPALRYDLTARGAPLSGDKIGAVEFFDCARSAINAAFLANTSDDARTSWGERQ